MNISSILIILTILATSTLLQSCSTSNNPSLNLTAVTIERDSNSLRKVSTIEYSRAGNGVGNDGLHGTSDDDVSRYFVINEAGYLGDASNKAKIVVYDSAGDDELWFTSDDNVLYSQSHEDDVLNGKFFAKFKIDWLRSKDQHHIRELSSIEIMKYLYLGILPEILNDGFGLYKVKRNGLDSSYDSANLTSSVYRIFADGEKQYKVNYDKLHFDEKSGIYSYSISYYSVTSREPNTNNEIIRNSSSPGIDGIWFNDDDVFSSGFTEIREEGSPLTERTLLRYSGSGVDGKWFTDDDLFHSREVSTFDNNGNLVAFSFVYSGDDNMMNTSDDYVFENYRQAHEYGESEYKVIRTHISNLKTEEGEIVWSDVSIYNSGPYDSLVPKNLKLKSILTPEGFTVTKMNVVESSSENEKIVTFESRVVKQSLSYSGSDIETILDAIEFDDLEVSIERRVKTEILGDFTYKTTLELYSSGGGNENFTYIVTNNE